MEYRHTPPRIGDCQEDESTWGCPFPAVFVVPSTPWRIDSTQTPGTHPLLSQHPLFMHARCRLRGDLMPPSLDGRGR